MACNWEPRLRVTQGKNPVITVGAVVEFHTEIQSAPQIVRNPQNPMSQMANFWRDKQGALRRRINEYCTDESHKEDFMNEALTEGYELWVRVKTSEGKKDAEDMENKLLEKYHCAWNIQKNGEIRHIPP